MSISLQKSASPGQQNDLAPNSPPPRLHPCTVEGHTRPPLASKSCVKGSEDTQDIRAMTLRRCSARRTGKSQTGPHPGRCHLSCQLGLWPTSAHPAPQQAQAWEPGGVGLQDLGCPDKGFPQLARPRTALHPMGLGHCPEGSDCSSRAQACRDPTVSQHGLPCPAQPLGRKACCPKPEPKTLPNSGGDTPIQWPALVLTHGYR